MDTALRFLITSCVFMILLATGEVKAQCGMTVSVTADPGYPWNLCPGENIELTSTVSGGTPPYTYLWSDGAITPNTTIIPPYVGQVYVMVTDATGCVEFGQIHIKASVWTVQFIYVGQSVCPGDSMQVHAYPDFPAGTSFLWSTGETTSSIFITTSATYSLTATAPGGACSSSVTEFIGMNFFPVPSPDISGPSVLCIGQNATLSVQENPDDIFSWSTGESTSSILISDPGMYSVTVTNWQGCVGTDAIEILEGSTPPNISAPSVLCNGQSGTVSVTNAGSYNTFLWNTGATSSGITINTAGTYTVTVTATGGCTATGSVTVAAGNSNITINGSVMSQTSCTIPNGNINITVTPPGSYSFLWSNGASTEDLNNLAAGNYTVTVTDLGGCTSTSTFTVASNLIIPTTSTNVTGTTCHLNNGAVDLSVIPSGTYSFLWSNGAITEDVSNILAGTYAVTVTSSGGCTATTTVSVPNNNTVINVTGITIPFTSCVSPNGAVNITAAPSGTYTYLWSNGTTTEDLVNLLAGDYTVTVSAGGSCTASATYSVPNNATSPVPFASSTPDTCGQNQGNIDLTVSPVGSYNFLWSNGATSEDLINIPGGIYSATVTSPVSGCMAMITDTVINYNPLSP